MLRQLLRQKEYRDVYANELKAYRTEKLRRQRMVIPRLSG
jgi:hypothetical protein